MLGGRVGRVGGGGDMGLTVSARCTCAELGEEAPCGWCDGPDRELPEEPDDSDVRLEEMDDSEVEW